MFGLLGFTWLIALKNSRRNCQLPAFVQGEVLRHAGIEADGAGAAQGILAQISEVAVRDETAAGVSRTRERRGIEPGDAVDRIAAHRGAAHRLSEDDVRAIVAQTGQRAIVSGGDGQRISGLQGKDPAQFPFAERAAQERVGMSEAGKHPDV